jgi:hypothetical protein
MFHQLFSPSLFFCIFLPSPCIYHSFFFSPLLLVQLYLYLYLYFNSINPYWLQKPSDVEHVTYAYIVLNTEQVTLQLHSWKRE